MHAKEYRRHEVDIFSIRVWIIILMVYVVELYFSKLFGMVHWPIFLLCSGILLTADIVQCNDAFSLPLGYQMVAQ